jgi:hypothetical protein
LYYEGHGVARDYVIAYMWSNLSVAGPNNREAVELASELRDVVAAKMTPAQIADAQKLAREWKPSQK